MRYFLVFLLLSLSVGTRLAESLPLNPPPEIQTGIGRRIYQEGITESGKQLRGESAAKITLSGKQAACIQCHRKSGLGTSEGKNTIRPITGDYLFPVISSEKDADKLKPTQIALRQRELNRLGRTRATYTPTTFARALREGVDGDGNALDKLMPRYSLNDDELAALEVYLRSLSIHADPGVDQDKIHFATVVLPGVDPAKSRAMLEILNAFVVDMNGETRSERRRRTVGTEVMYRSYRRWELHVWTLTGSPDSWQSQLEQQYKKQPVFAMLSGIGGENWRAVHEFCELHEIPSLFPNTALPLTESGYYSFYFSRGLALEAAVLAKYLAENKAQKGAIVQVFREGDQLGAEAARLLRSSLLKSGSEKDISDWSFATSPSADSWGKMLKEKRPHILVMWVNYDDLLRVGEGSAEYKNLQQIYLSASLLGGQAIDGSFTRKHLKVAPGKFRLIYPYELPARSAQNLQRINRWLRAKHIALADEQVQANTYFAAMVAGDAISHLLNHYSRDYFIEGVEHMVGRSLVTSVYPRLTLGPGQRFASRGAYLLKYSGDPGRTMQPATEWIVP